MRLNQITIGATDLRRSEQFYRLLGLRLIVENDHYLRFQCPEGDSTFSIELVESVPDGERVSIYFE
ncbi:VOC family protein, partial [Nocardia gipuzkoensis]